MIFKILNRFLLLNSFYFNFLQISRLSNEHIIKIDKKFKAGTKHRLEISFLCISRHCIIVIYSLCSL